MSFTGSCVRPLWIHLSCLDSLFCWR